MNDSEDIIEYLARQIRVSYTTLAWQKGMFCLRCDPLGIPCIKTESREHPWCPYCGKDPLFHGPLLMDRVFHVRDGGYMGFTTVKDVRAGDSRWRGSRPQKVIIDEIDEEVFNGRTTTASDRSGREPFQR